jgi:hypothetical protein
MYGAGRDEENIVQDEENIIQESQNIFKFQRIEKTIIDDESNKITPTQTELLNFNNLAVEIREQLISNISRLFFFAGSSKKKISRSTIKTSLENIDPEYKKHGTAVLMHVQERLSLNLGCKLVVGSSIIGANDLGKENEYFLISELENLELMKQSAESLSYIEHGFNGFKFMVFMAIFISPGWNNVPNISLFP